MEEFLSTETVVGLINSVWTWLQTNVLTLGAVVQLTAIAAAFGIAWFASRPLNAWLEGHRRHPVAGTGIRILLPLLMPLIWALLQWLSLAAAEFAEFPSFLLDSVTGLLFA
ncbi:MAG: hypothetical protein R3305_03485, partial [Gammaproteobacteria bacterium]|nr:hypothetical protein [Gammaproteobacteria bacterium]